jgi:DNA topoisomerase VI subunit A
VCRGKGHAEILLARQRGVPHRRKKSHAASAPSRVEQIAEYPRFAEIKPWQKEIKKMLRKGFKMEVEAMISKDLEYLTKEYVPAKLKVMKQWLV